MPDTNEITPADVHRLLQEFMSRNRQTYIGMRYVPVFADPIEWDSDTEYEPLTYVQLDGLTYISRAYVPAGVSPLEPDFWVCVTMGGQTTIMNRSYATATDMMLDDNLESGMMCTTAGFRSVNDGGAGTYIISATGTANGMDMLQCGDFVATLVVGDYVNLMQLGAYDVTGQASPTDMSHQQLQRALQISRVVDGGGKTYALSNTVYMNGNTLTDCNLNVLLTGTAYALVTSSGRNSLLRCSLSCPTDVNYSRLGISCSISTALSVSVCAFDGFAYGISCYGTATVNWCTFDNCTNGVNYGGTSNVHMFGCTFYGCTYGGNCFTSSIVHIVECTFNACTFGMTCVNNSITYIIGCTFDTCTYGVNCSSSTTICIAECAFDTCAFGISCSAANIVVNGCKFNGCGVPPTSSADQNPRPSIASSANSRLRVLDCIFEVFGHAISGMVKEVRNCTFRCKPQSGVSFNSRAISLASAATDPASEGPIVINGNTIESCYQYGIYVSHGYNEDSGHPKYVISNNVIREVKAYNGTACAVYVSSTGNDPSFTDGGFELMGNSSELPFQRANDAVVTTDLSLPPAAPYCSPYIRLVGCASIAKSDLLACSVDIDAVDSGITAEYVGIVPDSSASQPKTYLPFAAHECVGIELVISTVNTLRVHSIRDYDSQEYMVQLPSAESIGYSPLYACFPPSNGCPYFDLAELGAGWYAYEVGMMKRQCVWDGRQPADNNMPNIGYDGNNRSAVLSKAFVGGIELRDVKPIETEVRQ